VSLEKKESIYLAMTETASYEIVLIKDGKNNALQIKSWKRDEPKTEMQMHAMLEN
jgi:hypothetical protein